MEFSSFKSHSRFLDPRRNFEQSEVPSEIRVDPITQRTSRICHFSLPGIPPFDWESLKDPAKKGFCPFCPDTIESVTPKFPPDVIPEGRLFEGEATLMPNLMPYDEHSAVCVLTKAHVVPIEELLSSTMKSGFLLCQRYLKAVRNAPPTQEPLYGTLHMNFMPPSGGSLIHPHLQTFATRFPGNLHRLYLEKTSEYARDGQKNAFKDLIEAERQNGARYMGQLSKVHALTSFASFGLLGDILFVAEDVRDWFEDGVSQLGYLATLVSRTLKFFADLNLLSFNLALFSGAPKDEGFTSFALLTPRLFIEPRFLAPDVSALRFLYDEPFSVVYPEDIAEKLKPYLKL